MIILVRGVIAFLFKLKQGKMLIWDDSPKSFNIYRPIVACRFLDGLFRGLKRNVHRFSAIKGDKGYVLGKEWFKHYHFVSMFQECSKDGILTYDLRVNI